MADADDWIARVKATSLTTPSQYGGPASGSSTEGGLVYWGFQAGTATTTTTRTQRTDTARIPDLPNRYKIVRETGLEGRPVYVPEADARGLARSWYGGPGFDALVRRLVSLGLIDESDRSNMPLIDDIWNEAVDLSMKMTAAGRPMNPWTALALLGGESRRGRGGGGFTGTRSTPRVDLTDPISAKALVNETLSQYLGRNATDEEIRRFTATLNAAERANPVVETTTYKDGQAVSSVVSGGLDRRQVVTDEAMKLPEYGAVQAATTYFQALVDALSSPV